MIFLIGRIFIISVHRELEISIPPIVTIISECKASLLYLTYEIWFVFFFVDGQFNENCTSIEHCDPSKYLGCSSSNTCLCNSAYYHKDKKCFPSM